MNIPHNVTNIIHNRNVIAPSTKSFVATFLTTLLPTLFFTDSEPFFAESLDTDSFVRDRFFSGVSFSAFIPDFPTVF